MTQNVLITWDLPTTRGSGRPLDVSEIAFVDVEMSADDGVTFIALDPVPRADPQQVFVPDLEIGTWLFRFIVEDTSGRRSAPYVESVNVIDDTPPGTITNVQVTLS